MSEQKDRAVGIIFMTMIPAISEEVFAILQRRGRWNYERAFGPESWPGICQVSAHGRVREGEHLFNALHRECEEELGSYAADLVSRNKNDIVKVGDHKTKDKEVTTYALKIRWTDLNRMKINPSSAGLEFVSASQLPKVIDAPKHFKKETGVADIRTIAMFPNEIEALKKAFQLIG